MSSPEELASFLEVRGVVAASEAARALKISQPTFSRLAARLGRRLVRIGKGRATRYGLAREVRALGTRWPVYRIDAQGHAREVGSLHAVHRSDWWFEARGEAPGWLHGEFANGLFPGLPWFLADLRPQGFMGRSFARRYGDALGLPRDPTLWSADGILVAMLTHGEDLQGNFVVGEHALEQARQLRDGTPAVIARDARARRYAELAEKALEGEAAGSSAGGEQPKFTASVDDGGGAVRAVIVKFSGPIDTPPGRRWADLLVAEHLASEVLRAHDLPAVVSEVVESGGRYCLEVTRFDRVGAHGRRGFASLAALGADHHGHYKDWRDAADLLGREGWLAADDAERLRVLWWFSEWIANTDHHLGNVGVFVDNARPLTLAPAYDILPMHHRPLNTGEIVDRLARDPLDAPPGEAAVWLRAAEMGVSFWQRVADDTRVSSEFRRIAAEYAVRIAGRTRSG